MTRYVNGFLLFLAGDAFASNEPWIVAMVLLLVFGVTLVRESPRESP